MFNKYCGGLLFTMIVLVLIGVIFGIIGMINLSLGSESGFIYMITGFILFILGAMISSGFKTLKDSPREIGLISFFGKKTTCKVEGLVLLLKPFGWKIVDVVTISMKKEDVPFESITVTCLDRGVVTGKVSVQVIADDSDGDALKRFDDIGQHEGVKEQLDDIVESCIQAIGMDKPTDYMVTNGVIIGKDLSKKIREMISGLGFLVIKAQVKLNKTQRVIDAEQNSLVTDVMNTRIKKRESLYRENKQKTPSFQEIRKELIEEDLVAFGKMKEVRGGGVNVVNTDK